MHSLSAHPKPGSSSVRELERLTGHPVPPGFGLATHFHNLSHGLLPEEAAGLCTIMDYLALRLTAGGPCTDPTNGAGLGAFDLERGDFDRDALDRAGIDAALLPPVVSSGTVIGRCSGIPVTVPLGDNQASFLGAVTGITPHNFTPERLTAGFLRGIAGEMHGFFELMPGELRERIDHLVGSGNALRMNRRLRQALERRFDRPLRVPRHTEEAAFGAALGAAAGTGALPSFLEAGRAIPEFY